MRLGLIGLGRIGSFHADTLSQLAGVASLVWSPDGSTLHTLGYDGLWRWQTPGGEAGTRWLGCGFA